MAHIHTGEGQHDLTISAFIIRTDQDEPKVLLHWHKKLDAYLQFGGHVELDEDPWQAVTHEIAEESGYDIADLKLLQPPQRLRKLSRTKINPQPVCVNTHPFGKTEYTHSHIDLSYAFIAAGPPRAAVGEGESERLTLFSRHELNAIPDGDILENVREIALYVLDVCYENWEQVSTSEFD